MFKILLLRLFPLLTLLFLAISLSSFIDENYNDKEPKPGPSLAKGILTPPMASLRQPTDANQPVINDPIRFDIKSNTRQIVIGEEIELSISARLMNISPNLMFFLPGSNAYTLRMLLPAGFQQTGGNLTEFVSGDLDYPSQSEVTYTLRGFFTSTTENTCFRLLRSHGQATSQSLFVEKATLCLPVHSPDKQGAGRTAATNSSFNWCVEAENGSGNRGVSSSGQASAGQYTGSFGNNTEYMNYTITSVPSAGSYTLHIWYASGDNPQLGIVVNGNLQTSSVSSTSNWAGPFAENTVAISLQAGNNSLQIQGNGGGSFNIDRLCVDGGDGGGGCTPPSLSLGTPTCNGTTNYSVNFSAQAGSTVNSSAGSVQGNQVVNIPTGTNATITASLNGCSSQQTANSPTCNSGGGSTSWCVEAENGSGNRGVSSSGQASAGQYTGNFGNSSEYMDYTITGIPSAGSYTLHLWYASGDNPQLGIVINGNFQTISAPGNSNWAGPFAEKTVTVNLQAGNNSLRIQGTGAGGFNLDRLCVDGAAGGGGCTPPGLSLGTPTCNGTNNYSVNFSVHAGSTVSSSAGSVQGNQVVNIPTGTNATITASLNGCSSQQTANSPTCNSGGTPSGTGSGLTGFYTNSTDLSDYLIGIRTDAQINFSWSDSPIPGAVTPDGFSVRWFGQVEAPTTGNYTFRTNNDDGTRLWIGDQILINDWNGHPPTWQQGSIFLTAGQKYDIVIDFVDFGGSAQAQLYWEYPGQSLQLVPGSRLYPKVTITPVTASTPPGVGINDDTRSCYTTFGCLIFTVDCISGKIVNFSGNILANCGDSGGSPTPFPEPVGPIGPTSPTSPGGGFPGAPGGPSGPTRPKFLLPTGLSADELSRRKFYTDMQYKGIYFTADEVAVLNEYPTLRDNVRNYVNTYGYKPDGSNAFILSAADQQQYPRFTAIVRGMPDFVEQHDKVKQALIRHTNLPWSKIKPLLKFGLGPKIIIMDLTPTVGNVLGHTTHPGVPESSIQVQDSYVRGLESANYAGTREATAFLLTITMLHELTHYGAVDGGRNEIRFSEEFGADFEREVLGTVINRYNADQLRMDFYKP